MTLLFIRHTGRVAVAAKLGPGTYSTIGEEKKSNYALQPQTKDAFIKAVTDELAAPPQYFPVNAQINKEGYEALDAVLEKGLTPLSVTDLKAIIQQENTILLDTRPVELFTQGFIPGAISIGA